MGRNNADLHGITFRYEQDAMGDHNIVAEHPTDGEVGRLTWSNHDYEEGAQEGEVVDVRVWKPEWRRKGIATRMWEEAKKAPSQNEGKWIPEIRHSDDLSEDGEAWSKAVGG